MTSSTRLLLFAAFIVVTIVVPAGVSFYTDWLWFGETGYGQSFSAR